jgi:hypothetical protein
LNKKLLVISPYFPPANAADMQRVRMSLPYFRQFGWDAEIVTVDPKYSEISKDELLVRTIPVGIKIHLVKAFDKKLTSKFGLGSIALRSLWFYRKKINQLLKTGHFDLIYFSTTQFPVCILGAYWKKRFKIPYVIDMQDPWFSDYYEDKPSEQRPAKYWFSFWLNKYLEPKAMRHVDGLISVSEKYMTDLKERYPVIKDIPAETITFGAFEPDHAIAEKNKSLFDPILNPATRNIVYIGRGGADMHAAVSILFKAFKAGLEKTPGLFNKIRLYFIGTSYAPTGYGVPTISPLAKQFGIEDNVIEITDRISYYHTLLTLQQADALFIPGSDDPKYTASKIYPYILTGKPLLAIFNPQSSAIDTLREYGVKHVYDYAENNDSEICAFLKQVAEGTVATENYNSETIKRYSAENMTRRQCELFDKLILNK